MKNTVILAKIKFDLRDPNEARFAQYEIESILNTEVKPVKMFSTLFKNHPFNKLNDDIIRIIARQLYLGEIQGYIANVKSINANKLILQPAFF